MCPRSGLPRFCRKRLLGGLALERVWSSLTLRRSASSVSFFRPSPSRLSPGRKTVFVPVNELGIAYQHPALGSQKRARTITQSMIQSGVQKQRSDPNTNKTTKTRNKPPKKQNKSNKTKNTPFDGRALSEQGSLCAHELGNDLAESNTEDQPESQQDRDEGAKTKPSISSAETQDPPRQDPGDRTVKPIGHEAPSHA